MKPLNRRLLIEVINEEPQQGAFFVPVEEKVEDFLAVTVLACASDCAQDLTGKKVIIHSFGREDVVFKGKQYTFIGEAHLVCVE